MIKTFDMERLRQQLIKHEGVKDYAYQDSKGYWTIGIGHLIDARKGGKISQDTIHFIFEEDLDEKVADLDKYLPWWRSLDETRQRVLIDMCFNMGIGNDHRGLLSFKNALNYIEMGDYKEASKHMLDSKWAKDVGQRAITLSQMMEYGV